MATQGFQSESDKIFDLTGGAAPGGTAPSSQHGTSSTIPSSLAPVESKISKTVVKKSKQFKSEIWNHFGQIYAKPDDKKYHHCVCNYCKKEYGCNTATATLWGHLDRCLTCPLNKSRKKQKTLESFTNEEGESKLMSWKFNQLECRKAIVKMLIMDELPFSFIEREGFNLFCSVAVPRLQLVTRVTIAKDCLKLYVQLKKELKSSLSFNAQRICLTTDTWTSLQNLSYMVLTAHFIDHNWKLHKRILKFCPVSSHKGAALGTIIESCMLDWGIQKIFTLTVDNASANDTCIAHLKKKLSKKQAFVLDGEFFHIRCCAHILNLIVKDGMKEDRGSIEKIRLAGRYIRGSPQRSEQFKKCCELDENPYKNNLILDVPTRWNYTYLMLETALKFQKSFERFEEMDPNFLHELKDKAPGEDDWKTARIFCKFLKKFYEVTNRLSDSLYVTANSYFHDVIRVQLSIKDWSSSADPTLQLMALKMEEKFDKYWGDLEKINMMLLIAVVLDPNFKLKYVTFIFGSIYPKHMVDKLESKLRETLNRLYAYYESISSLQTSNVGESSIVIEADQECMVVDTFTALKNHFASKEEGIGNSKSELEMYLEEAIFKNNNSGGESFDILAWWKLNASRFPVLSLMARDVLAIPVSTVASESAFSTGGRVLDQFRSSLSPKVAESLICSQDWLRASPLPIELESRLDDLIDIESCITDDPEIANGFTGPLT